jgi:hypothetical protein
MTKQKPLRSTFRSQESWEAAMDKWLEEKYSNDPEIVILDEDNYDRSYFRDQWPIHSNWDDKEV